MFEWNSPWFLSLLALIVVALVFRFMSSKGMRPSFQVSRISIFKKVPRGFRVYLSYIPNVLRVVALILIVVALARPQKADTKIKRNVEGIDIMVALDISDSMLIEDMKPQNRMGSAKKTIREFVEGRLSDRIGLVLFSGESFTRVPLTLDYDILLENLATVTATRSVKPGTAIGVALANAVARLKDSVAKSRIVILLTDGENNSGTIAPETALDIAKGFGIKVYTIGVGRDGQAQIPVFYTSPFGKRQKTYQPIHSKVNDELLSKIAKETGGKYYRATHSSALKKVFDNINSLEKTKIEINQFTRYKDYFERYLKWALALYLGSLLVDHLIVRRVP